MLLPAVEKLLSQGADAFAGDPLAGLSVTPPPPPSAGDPFASIASGAPESLSPGGRSELPADIFSAAPAPAFSPPGAYGGMAGPPGVLGTAAMPPTAFPGSPQGGFPGLMPMAPAAAAPKAFPSHMGGPPIGGAPTMQIPPPAKKDPFADLF